MDRDSVSTTVVARLPIAGLSAGDVGPPMQPGHESWRTLAGWEDPLAPRGGYRVPADKTRIDTDDGPAIEWVRHHDRERALVTGQPTWREYRVECRVQALQAWAGPSRDGWFIAEAMAGIAFRIETSRHFYYFCLEGQRRLVLYRRIDDEWAVLGAEDVHYHEEILTLRVSLDGDGIHAECPELDVEMFATDTLLRTGRVGFRALGQCRLFDLSVSMTPSQQETNKHLARQLVERTAHVGSSVPDAVEVGEIDLSDGRGLLACSDFCQAGRNDLLFSTSDGLVATTWEGEELWRVAERPAQVKMAAEATNGSRCIYILAGERMSAEQVSVGGVKGTRTLADEAIVVKGATGDILARTKLPEDPGLKPLDQYDFSFETGRLTGDQSLDIVVRQWRKDTQGGGRDLWAYDADLKLLWHQRVDPPYGHHNAVHLFDVNGDGRSEVIAGGTLLSADGNVLWVHDRAEEERRIANARHYDAVLVGNFAEDAEDDPIALLIGGSAGVYVVDALTGRTRAAHRIGHAQWGMVCKVRDDLPGKQLMAGTRWGNFGILTLLSGRGERLWTIQPDYVLQGSCPVQWVEGGPQHIWLNTSPEGQGLYDGHGRLVKPLDTMRRLWGDRTRMDIQCQALRREPNACDLLGVKVGGRIRLFAPETA